MSKAIFSPTVVPRLSGAFPPGSEGHRGVCIGAVEGVVVPTVVDVAPGAVVVGFRGVVVVVVVVVEVVLVVVVVVVVEVEGVVVVGGGVTPSMTPPTVVPDFEPPKIDDRERPALSSTSVTTLRASPNAASADAVAITEIRKRRWVTNLSAGRLDRPLTPLFASDPLELFIGARLSTS